jgi:hypothetical protein
VRAAGTLADGGGRVPALRCGRNRASVFGPKPLTCAKASTLSKPP